MNVSVNILATVTAGLANEVEEVNQYPAVIKSMGIHTINILIWWVKLKTYPLSVPS